MRAARMCLLAGVALAPIAAAEDTAALVGRQAERLRSVRAIFVEPLTGEGSKAIQDMLIGALQRTSRWVITEDADKADARLRGSAEDLIYQEYDRYREGINVRGFASNSRRNSGESTSGSASFGVGENEDGYSQRRRHEAAAAVRIVMNDGEVVWSSTQESKGAKYRSAAAEVAARVVEDLARALDQAGTP